MPNTNKTYIAYFRLTPYEKEALQTIVKSLPGNQSEHIRQAVKEYCDRVLPTLKVSTPQA